MATYIFGHTTPDSDSIVGALSLSYLKNKLGEDTIPARQGEINPETAWILEKFGYEAPQLKNSYAGENVYLIDFMESSQSPADIAEATILGIVDHHKLGDLKTDAPLEMWVRPVGCSNTIVKQMFDHYGIEIPKNLAGMMMCAILSDTVIFKSPTCTKEDTKACKELAEIAEIEDYKALGMEMFIVKSDVLSATSKELVPACSIFVSPVPAIPSNPGQFTVKSPLVNKTISTRTVGSVNTVEKSSVTCKLLSVTFP